jgi:hypothetical protein
MELTELLLWIFLILFLIELIVIIVKIVRDLTKCCVHT